MKWIIDRLENVLEYIEFSNYDYVESELIKLIEELKEKNKLYN